jgi:hypothetical protein
MKRWYLILSIFVLWSITASIVAAHTGTFTGFKGTFLRGIIGYVLIIALSHTVLLPLPKMRLRDDVRMQDRSE